MPNISPRNNAKQTLIAQARNSKDIDLENVVFVDIPDKKHPERVSLAMMDRNTRKVLAEERYVVIT